MDKPITIENVRAASEFLVDTARILRGDRMPTEKELLEKYVDLDAQRHQAQENINRADELRQELQNIADTVANPAPVYDAVQQVEDTIVINILDRNQTDRESSNVADAILQKDDNA